MFKNAVRSTLISPTSHFVPADDRAAHHDAQPIVDPSHDTINRQRAAAVSIQGMPTQGWVPASAGKLRAAESILYASMLAYCGFCLASKLGLF